MVSVRNLYRGTPGDTESNTERLPKRVEGPITSLGEWRSVVTVRIHTGYARIKPTSS